MPMTGAAYLRCSDPRQDKSIEPQREEILRRAEADGVTIPPGNWFIDEGISGRSVKKRASYLHLIKRAEAQRDAIRAKKRGAQQIDRLYVWAFSRVVRLPPRARDAGRGRHRRRLAHRARRGRPVFPQAHPPDPRVARGALL